MNWEEINKKLINGAEQRIGDYKALLEQVGRNRELWPPQDEFTQWFRAHLRQMKNYEESLLGVTREEQRWTRQSLNPPYCYNFKLRELDGKPALISCDVRIAE